MNFKHLRYYLFTAYLLVRGVSFFYPPDTPLHSASIVNMLVAGILIIATAYLLIKKNVWGWYVVASEIILGGAGNFFALGGVSLRTCLLFLSLGIFFVQNFGNLKNLYRENKTFIYTLSALYAVAALAAVRGAVAGHGFGAVFADTIPYLFFLYYFPIRQLLDSDHSEDFKNFVQTGAIAAIIGNALFILFTLFAFSSGLSALQGTLYHWFRDVAGGKITELPFHFYRIVLNEQVILIPLILWQFNSMLQRTGRKWLSITLTASLLIILSLNLTRSFILALGVGILLVFRPKIWKRWLVGSIVLATSFIAIFIGIHLTASRGQSLGLEIFGLRLQSIVTPSMEESSLSRLLLLPKIVDKIKASPIIGDGLADTVTVYSPVVKKEITTSQFDWGYLEIWAELGLVGLVAWGSLLLYLSLQLKKDRFVPAWKLGSTVGILIITLTSPALFHVLGIVWLATVAATQSIRVSQKSFS